MIDSIDEDAATSGGDDALVGGDPRGLLAPIEAVLMVAPEPVTPDDLADALDVDVDLVAEALKLLAAEYRGTEGRRPHGFVLNNVAGGWRIYSDPRWADVVGRFVVGSASSRLSQAALETLAIIAYRQPVTRSRISQIRGVNVDAVVRTLVARGLVEDVGETPTGAHQYATTEHFLERMGMNSLDELVPLAPYLPAVDELDELESELED